MSLHVAYYVSIEQLHVTELSDLKYLKFLAI
jgi:hypothetical protein